MPAPTPPRTRDELVHPADAAASGTLNATESKLLGVLASPLVPGGKCTRSRLFTLAGYSRRSSTPREALRELRRRGLVELVGGPNFPDVQLTAAGRAAAGKTEHVPTAGPDLAAYWMRRLGDGAQSRILEYLVRHRRPVAFATMLEALDYSTSSSTPREALRELRRLGLVEGDAWELRASKDLLG